MEIMSAPWVIPSSGHTIKNGAVAVEEGKVKAIGTRKDIVTAFQGAAERRFASVLIPGLVNGHCHLELSYLGRGRKPLDGEIFTQWIEKLLEKKEKVQASRQEIEESIEKTLRQQYDAGVALLLDTGNMQLNTQFSGILDKVPSMYPMVEFLAPSRDIGKSVRSSVDGLSSEIAVTAHAPYSTGPEIIQYIKKRCRKNKQLFSIHTSESIHEHEFLCHQTGPFRRFLEKRGTWDPSYFTKNKTVTTVEYFNALGILDDRTLLVHCVNVTSEDLDTIERSKASVCVCPGSNRFLKVGVAPVKEMLKRGILPAIGTDSISSNLSLDMWGEMRQLHQDHPDISLEKILLMATLGGANALGKAEEYGVIRVGGKVNFLHVSSEKLLACSSADELYQVLVTCGKPEIVSHVAGEIP